VLTLVTFHSHNREQGTDIEIGPLGALFF